MAYRSRPLDSWLLTLLGVAVALVGCTSGSPDARVLSEADSGNEIRVEAGQQIEIRLESNPTTGYRWEIAVETEPGSVAFRTHSYEEPNSDLVGAAGQEILVFEAIDGAEVLRLEYVRPFDDPVIPKHVVEYIIRVDDAVWPPENVDPPATSSAIAPIEIGELLASQAPTDASVIGYVVIDAAGNARLCEALAESFPPQCGGAAISIANPDDLTVALEREQSVQWTNERVRLDGNYDGTRFTLSA